MTKINKNARKQMRELIQHRFTMMMQVALVWTKGNALTGGVVHQVSLMWCEDMCTINRAKWCANIDMMLSLGLDQ